MVHILPRLTVWTLDVSGSFQGNRLFVEGCFWLHVFSFRAVCCVWVSPSLQINTGASKLEP